MNDWRIGVDVGGTKIAAGLVSPAGRISERLTVPTPAAEGASSILRAIGQAVETLRGKVSPGDALLGQPSPAGWRPG